jgi:hypothetical protein
MNKIVALTFLGLTTVCQAQTADEFGSIGQQGAPAGGIPAVCSDPAIVSNNDGTAENGYSGNSMVVAEVTLLERFSAASFPNNTISDVCIGWVSLGTPDLNFEIVVFDDDGAGGAPGTELGAVAGNVTGLPMGLPETVIAVDVSGAAITLPAAGDVYVGARYIPPAPNIFVAADETGASNVGAGQLFFDTGDPMTDDWQPINSLFPNYSSLFVSALPGEAAQALPPPPAVPTMNSFGLLGMALALMLGAGLFLRRRA